MKADLATIVPSAAQLPIMLIRRHDTRGVRAKRRGCLTHVSIKLWFIFAVRPPQSPSSEVIRLVVALGVWCELESSAGVIRCCSSIQLHCLVVCDSHSAAGGVQRGAALRHSTQVVHLSIFVCAKLRDEPLQH